MYQLTFEAWIIIALLCIVACLIWHTLCIMDDRTQLQAALDTAEPMLMPYQWAKVVSAYEHALDLPVSSIQP
jgi:ABC-type transport system involved in Fe-S cluster assembly fused permease/ATPase subunit